MKIIFATVPNSGEFNIIFSIANKLSEIVNEEILFMTADSKKEIVEKNKKIKFISMGRMESINDTNINLDSIYKESDLYTNIELFSKFFSADVYKEPYEKIIETMENKLFDINNCIMVIDVASFFALDFAVKYNIPFVITCPIDPSSHFMSKLNWSYPCIFNGYNSDLFTIIRSKLEISMYMMYEIMFRKLGKDRIEIIGSFISSEEIIRKSKATICSNIWEIVQPFDHPHNLYMVGPIIEKENNNNLINKDLIKWINKDNKKIILVCFGTLAILSEKVIENLQVAFENITNQYEVKIIWKIKNNLIESTDNIKIVNWIPSIKEILNNEKVILNIHHGGANTFQETLYYGIPQLVIPFWSDCYGIARRTVECGIGLTINDNKNSYKEIENNIKILLDNNEYKKACDYFKNKCKKGGGLNKSIEIINDILDDLKYKN